jgi:hypothetical protein
MDENVKQLIKDRINQLPKEIRQAILDPSLSDKFTEIANRHALRVDQNGELQLQTLLVMLALRPSDEYVDTLEKELGVSNREAQALADEVNREILGSLRQTIRSVEEEEEREDAREEVRKSFPPEFQTPTSGSTPTPTPAPKIPVSPIEKAGNFTVNRPSSSNSPQYNDSTLKKEEVLADLEQMKKLKPENAEQYVEHLIANPVSMKETPVPTPRPPQQAPAKPQENRKYTEDPYREEV